MQIKISTKYLKTPSKKMQPIVSLIKGKKVEEAINQLKFLPKKGGRFLLKSLESGVANARHNFNLPSQDLIVKEVLIGEGPMLKRWTPKALGSATPFRKRTSHLTIILETKPGIEIKKEIVKKEKVEELPIVEEVKKETKVVKEEKLKKPEEPEISKRVFDVRRVASGRHKQNLDRLRRKEKGGIIGRIFRRKAGDK